MTLTELKAAAYDQLAVIEKAQRELAAINQQIAEQIQTEQTAVVTPPDTAR